jgi:hypothetical protein
MGTQDELWSLRQAAYRLCGEEPRDEETFRTKDRDAGGPVGRAYEALKNSTIAQSIPFREVDGTIDRRRVTPEDAVAWASERGMTIPPMLRLLDPRARYVPDPEHLRDRLKFWLKCDTWTTRDGLRLLACIDPHDSSDLTVHYDPSTGRAGTSCAMRGSPATSGFGVLGAIPSFLDAGRMLQLRDLTMWWHSDPERAAQDRHAPSVFLDFAAKKGHKVQWLDVARDAGLLPVDTREPTRGHSAGSLPPQNEAGTVHWTLERAAQDIGTRLGWHEGAIATLTKQMTRAARAGELRVRHPHTDLRIERDPQALRNVCEYYELVTREDVNEWLAKERAGYTWDVETFAEPAAEGSTNAGLPDAGPEGGEASSISGAGEQGVRWTPELKAEVRAYRDKLKADCVSNYTAQTAAKYGVSVQRLRAILSDGATKKPASESATKKSASASSAWPSYPSTGKRKG